MLRRKFQNFILIGLSFTVGWILLSPHLAVAVTKGAGMDRPQKADEISIFEKELVPNITKILPLKTKASVAPSKRAELLTLLETNTKKFQTKNSADEIQKNGLLECLDEIKKTEFTAVGCEHTIAELTIKYGFREEEGPQGPLFFTTALDILKSFCPQAE